MIETLLHALESAPFIRPLRVDVVLYSFVSGLHILAIGTLVGTIISVDLRMIGIWKSNKWLEGIGEILPITQVAFIFALTTGFLLFSINGVRYLANDAFLIKMGILCCALVNIFVFHRLLYKDRNTRTRSMRISSAFSLVFWVAAVFAGRAIAYI